MQRIHNKPPSIPFRIFKHLFLNTSVNSSTLEVCLLYLEFVTFIVYVCQPMFYPNDTDPNTQSSIHRTWWIERDHTDGDGLRHWFWLILLFVEFVTRCLTGLTLVRGSYIICAISLIMWKVTPPIAIATIVLLMINIIIDVSSHIQFEFNTKNPFSQTLNYNKLLHYPIMLAIAIMQTLLLPSCPYSAPSVPSFVIPTVSIILLAVVLLSLLPSVPAASPTISSFISPRQCLIRFYILVIAYFVLNMLHTFIDLSNGWLRFAILVGLQGVAQGIWRRLRVVKVGSQLSSGNIIPIFYRILGYLYGDGHDQDMEIIMKEFLEQSNIIQNPNVELVHSNVKKLFVQNNSQSNRLNIKKSVYNASSQPISHRTGQDQNLISNSRASSIATDHYCDPNPYPATNPNTMNPCYRKKRGLYDELSDGNEVKFKIARKIQETLLEGSFGIDTGRIGYKDRISRKIDNVHRAMMILAQLKFWVYGDLIGSLSIIEELKLQTSSLFWVQRLCIYKFQQKLFTHIHLQYNLALPPTYQQFFPNETLRSLILKSSHQHLSLWSYIANPTSSISFSTLSNLFMQTLKNNQKIDGYYKTGQIEKDGQIIHEDIVDRKNVFTKYGYEEQRIWCQSIVLMYVDYLYMVRRDVDAAKAVYRKYEVAVEDRYWGNVDNRIYICFLLDQEGIKGKVTIQNVSLNVRKLLGYSRSSLKSSTISPLLPSFFLEPHQKLIEQYCCPPTNGDTTVSPFYSFSKIIMIKHCDEYYLPAKAELKLVVDWEGAVKMQGYIQMLQEKKEGSSSYNWSNYFFVKAEDDELVQVGPALRELIQIKPRKFVSCNDYFESHHSETNIEAAQQIKQSGRGETNKYFYHNGNQYTYHLLRVFHSQQSQYLYFCLSNWSREEWQLTNKEGINQKIMSRFQNYLSDCLKHQKYPTKYEDYETNIEQYFKQKQRITGILNNKCSTVLFVVVVFCFLCALTMEAVMISRVQSSKNDNQKTKDSMMELINFYYQLGGLGMHIQRQRFIRYQKIQYDYHYFEIKDLCLSLQYRTQSLKPYDIQNTSISITPPYNRSLISLTLQLISQFSSNRYLMDPELQQYTNKGIDEIFPYLWQLSITEPLSKYLATTINILSEDNRIKISIQVTVCFLVLAVYATVLFLDTWVRQSEYEALRVLAMLDASGIFCNGVTEFLRRAAGGVNQNDLDQQHQDNDKKKNALTTQRNSKLQLISSISARENSVRNLYSSSPFSSFQPAYQQTMMQSSTNREHRLHPNQPNTSLPFNTLEMKQKKQNDEYQRKQLKIRPRSKTFMAIWTIGMLLIVGIAVGFIIYEQTTTQVSLVKAVGNLLVILQRKITFSSTILNYLYTISNQIPPTPESFTLFRSHYSKYTQISNKDVTFEQAKFPQFTQFAKLYQQVNYVYLCEFTQCQQKYRNDVDIIYNSAVHRFMSYMLQKSSVSWQNNQQTQKETQLLFYVHYLLQKTLNSLLKSYLFDFTNFEQSKYQLTTFFYQLQLIVLILYLSVAVLYYFCHVRTQTNKYAKFMDFIKKESYEISEPK